MSAFAPHQGVSPRRAARQHPVPRMGVSLPRAWIGGGAAPWWGREPCVGKTGLPSKCLLQRLPPGPSPPTPTPEGPAVPRETTVCRAVGTGCGGGKKDLLVVPQRPVGALAWKGFPVRLKGKASQDWRP